MSIWRNGATRTVSGVQSRLQPYDHDLFPLKDDDDTSPKLGFRSASDTGRNHILTSQLTIYQSALDNIHDAAS